MCASRLCVQKAPAHFIKGENLLKLTYPNVTHWLISSLYVLIYDCPILIFTVLSVSIHNFAGALQFLQDWVHKVQLPLSFVRS